MINVILLFVQQLKRSFLDLTKGDIWRAACYIEVDGGHSMVVVICAFLNRSERQPLSEN